MQVDAFQYLHLSIVFLCRVASLKKVTEGLDTLPHI
jgi:hypothetical protein